MIERRNNIDRAYQILKEWRKKAYVVGVDAFSNIGPIIDDLKGVTVLVIYDSSVEKSTILQIQESISAISYDPFVITVTTDSHYATNEEIYRIESYILHHHVDVVIAVGGNASIDIAKGGVLLSTVGAGLSNEISSYFGVDKVSKALKRLKQDLIPILAIQTSTITGTHISKYVNILDSRSGEKRLIVDEALIPTFSISNYKTLLTVPLETIIDGALDAIAHVVEAFFSIGDTISAEWENIVELVVKLVFTNLKILCNDSKNESALEGISVAADLGGYAIMLGGTSGAHLTSFALANILPHGLASFLMNPYYIMSYRNHIEPQLKFIEELFYSMGIISDIQDSLEKKALVISKSFQSLLQLFGLPISLKEVSGFDENYLNKVYEIAKNPQLAMKFENMPIQLSANDIDDYMLNIHNAAYEGDLELVDQAE